MIDTKNLRTLAEAAKGWGNCNQAWLDSSEDEPAAVVGHISEDGEKYPVVVVDCDQYYAAQDSIKLARFYAAANATTMLALLNALERKDAALRTCLDACKCVLEQVKSPPAEVDFAIEAITKEIGT